MITDTTKTDMDTSDGAEAVEIGPENIGASVMALRNLDGPLSYSYRDFVASQLEALAAERDELERLAGDMATAIGGIEQKLLDELKVLDAQVGPIPKMLGDRNRAVIGARTAYQRKGE